jgi:hypothetical protein
MREKDFSLASNYSEFFLFLQVQALRNGNFTHHLLFNTLVIVNLILNI